MALVSQYFLTLLTTANDHEINLSTSANFKYPSGRWKLTPLDAVFHDASRG
jgi:hypothetical protein